METQLTDLWNISQVTQWLGVTRQTIHVWEREGKFPRKVALGPNCARWRKSDLEQWLVAKQN